MKNGEMLGKMLVMAAVAHDGQFDKGGKPYILHCLQVMHNLKSDDEELQCIALGHDIIEDTKTTWHDLEEAGFSKRVVSGIRAMTKQNGYSYDEYKLQVFANKDAMKVKIADLMHNSDIRRLKGVTEKDINRMAKYHRFYLEIQTKLDKDIE